MTAGIINPERGEMTSPMGWAVGGAVAVLPFLLLLPIDFDRLAPLAILPALWIAQRNHHAAPAQRVERFDLGLLVFAALSALLSSVTGPHPSPSMVSLSSWAWIIATALLVREYANNPTVIRAVLGGITTGATLGCLTVWLNWREETAISAFPLYGHGRVFGLHMMVGTMTGLALLIERDRRKLERLLIGLGTVITCGGLLWAGGRSGILGVAVGWVIWLWRLSPHDRRRLITTSLMVMVGGLALSLLNWAPQSYLGWWTAAERSAAATSINELSSTRLNFWQTTWQYYIQSPWFGRGADAYRYLTPKLDGDQPHNWALQFLLDFGLVGGGALAVLLVRQAVRSFLPPTARSHAEDLRLGAGAGLVACLITGLLDGVFYHVVVLVPAAVLAGIAGSVTPAPLPSARITSTSSRVNATARVVLIWAALGVSGVILAVHSYLVFHLRYLPPPAGPEALPARILRSFPSTTLGLDTWLVAWRARDESAVLEWTLWAQSHSQAPARLHIYAAVIYADRDDFAAADREMEQAEKTVHWTALESVVHMRKSIREAAGANLAPPL